MTNDVFYKIIIIFTIFSLIFWYITRFFEEKSFLRILTLSSLCYGILITILVRTIFGNITEDPEYFPDSYFYIECATKKVAEWRDGTTMGYIPLPTRGYVYFIAIIYLIFGQNIYIVIFVQLLLASLIPFLTFLIAHEFFSIKTAKLSALFVAFFPDFYVWASFALKEVMAVFLICLAMLQFLKFNKHPNLIGFLTTIGPCVVLLFVRPHIALFLALVFALAFVLPVTIKKAIWLAAGATAFTISMSQAGLPDFQTIVFEFPLPVYNRGEILTITTLPELLRMVISGQLLPNLLLGIGRYLLSPLPWKATGAYQAVIPGIILWYCILPIATWGTTEVIRTQKKHAYILIIAIVFSIFWYGLILTGTDPRWRLMIVPFVCILGAYGFQLFIKNL